MVPGEGEKADLITQRSVLSIGSAMLYTLDRSIMCAFLVLFPPKHITLKLLHNFTGMK